MRREKRLAMAEFKNFARLGRRCATHYAPLFHSVKRKLILEHLDRQRIIRRAPAAPKCGVVFNRWLKNVEDSARATWTETLCCKCRLRSGRSHHRRAPADQSVRGSSLQES